MLLYLNTSQMIIVFSPLHCNCLTALITSYFTNKVSQICQIPAKTKCVYVWNKPDLSSCDEEILLLEVKKWFKIRWAILKFLLNILLIRVKYCYQRFEFETFTCSGVFSQSWYFYLICMNSSLPPSLPPPFSWSRSSSLTQYLHTKSGTQNPSKACLSLSKYTSIISQEAIPPQ